MSIQSARRAFLLIALLAAGCRPDPYTWHGSPYPDPRPAPPLPLADTSGVAFELGASGAAVTLVYFGYTYCPDVCPATVADVAWSMEQLGPLADQVTFVFVTIDPDRDPAEIVRRFLDNFDAHFVGLTGSPDDLASAREAYGVFAQVEPSSDPEAYLITHTSRLFLIDPDGLLVTSYPFGTPRTDLLADLRHALEGLP